MKNREWKVQYKNNLGITADSRPLGPAAKAETYGSCGCVCGVPGKCALRGDSG